MVKAVAVLESNQGVSGTVFFSQNSNGPTTVAGNITGLKSGLHGFHVMPLGTQPMVPHQLGHISTLKEKPMVPPMMRIVMLVILEIWLPGMMISLVGPNSVLGSSIVVHADPDDLGRGRTELSLTTGNADERIGCGVIGL